MTEDILSERYWKKQEKIPGSTRIPIKELRKELKSKSGDGKTILDLGSGEGRSTLELKENFPKANIVAFDLSREGLKKTTKEVSGLVLGTALDLPFDEESADAVILCGVMTNITDVEPPRAVEARKKVLNEVARVLKPKGICIISDFSNKHIQSNYPVNYHRHQLITGEYGTVAVFDPSANINFVGKNDDEVSLLAKSPYLKRFAHHYSPEEFINLTEDGKVLKFQKTQKEVGLTPSSKPIDTLVMTFRKP